MARSSALKICRSLRHLAECPHFQALFFALAVSLFLHATAANAEPLETSPGEAAGDNLALVLELTINGAPRGLVRVVERQGALWADGATLRELGFQLPEATPDPVRLDALPGVQLDYDASLQTLAITAPLTLLTLSTTVLDTAPLSTRTSASASPGALLNYNLYGAADGQGGAMLNAYGELRLFNARQVFSSTGLMQSGKSEIAPYHTSSVRLDTSWSTSDPDSLVTWRVGDTLSAALAWSRATRIGGLQVGTNFDLQPYLVTTPVPAFFGSVTLPSAVDLYVNGVRQYSARVPAGPFRLNTVPNISGAGSAQLVMTNALGQTSTLNFSLYGAQSLLRSGLSDWSLELGFVRENYGIESSDYSEKPMASGTWRRGLSDRFTAEAHGEASDGLVNAGLGAHWLLGRTAGIASAAVGGSVKDGQSGGFYGLAYSWNDTRYSLELSSARTAGDYRDVATLHGSPVVERSDRASVGYNGDTFGNFGLSFLDSRYPDQSPTRYATAYWSYAYSRQLSFSASANRSLVGARETTVFVAVALSLDDGVFINADYQRARGRRDIALSASRSVPSDGGLGWRVSAGTGENGTDATGELEYLGRRIRLTGGLSRVSGSEYGYASAEGALVWMAGQPFAAQSITSGFAVVSTNGVADVPVELENNPVGVTNAKGFLLVTPLNAYQHNRISIDALDLPPDLRVGAVSADTTPTDRAGALVRFDIQPVRAATLLLVDAAGRPLPQGSEAHLAGSEATVLVGFDGIVYLDSLAAQNVLEVSTPTGLCRVSFEYKKEGTAIPQLGPLRCEEVSP
ncbi:fimbria/pilus outer membrane usher protein [Niveibacterium sp. SC-1]|uniref:fimbria/pilus outer membrane usher protein n=1 Tax=Niveibacterium sp. SC-1 TaxID=3135646 RepID=UPI00311E23DC